MKKLLLILALFFFCWELSNCNTVNAETCSEQPVTVVRYSLYAEALNEDLIFDIYLPPCMDDRISGGYPVLYLLHGQNMGIEVWQEMEMDKIMQDTINDEELPLFITVVPQEDKYLLSLSLSGFDDAILDTLIPWVDEHYNTCANRQCRGIAGLSRGALWAEKIAFEHPYVFGALGLMSLPGEPFDDQTLYYLAGDQPEGEELRVRIDIGSEDNYRHDAAKASTQLTYIGYSYEYTIQPGGHDTEYWRKRLPEYFVWFSEGWE